MKWHGGWRKYININISSVMAEEMKSSSLAKYVSAIFRNGGGSKAENNEESNGEMKMA